MPANLFLDAGAHRRGSNDFLEESIGPVWLLTLAPRARKDPIVRFRITSALFREPEICGHIERRWNW